MMGILNVTPDSFYAKSRKGGLSLSGLVAAAGAMCRGGAAIVDIGGESTRPGATPVSPQEEIRRVVPVVEALVGQLPEVCVSVDTRHVEVARAAVAAGAAIINDVRGCDPEPGMWELVDYFPQQAMPGFEVAVWNDGTVNNHTDRDRSWTVEARIPLKELAKYGSPLQTGATGWTVLFARHNYGNSIAAREPSSFPQCPGLNFHVPELFLPLDFHEIKENTGISPR